MKKNLFSLAEEMKAYLDLQYNTVHYFSLGYFYFLDLYVQLQAFLKRKGGIII